MKQVLTLGLILSLVLVNSVSAVTLHVPADHATITAAINAGQNGDSIIVAPGWYSENLNFAGKQLIIVSAEGAEKTIIDGGGVAPCVVFNSGETGRSRLIKFTLTNGKAIGDGYGGGVLIEHSSPAIGGCIIWGNTASAGGGGISVSGDSCNPRITHNLIYGNYTDGGGGGISLYQCKGMIINNTIINNHAAQGGAGVNIPFTNGAQVYNNIIADNNGGGIAGWNTQNAMITYNNAFGNEGEAYSNVEAGEGSIALDPAFTNPDSGWYSLQAGSPCIDNGWEQQGFLDPDGSREDIGSYYFHQRDLQPSVWEYRFPPLDLGEVDSVMITFTNVGKTPLHLTDIVQAELESRNIHLPDFHFEPPYVLDPSASYEYWAYCRPTDPDSPVRHVLFVLSDDIDAPELQIEFLGSIQQNVDGLETPEKFALFQAYPNPFNSNVRLSYELSSNTGVTLQVFDINGNQVAELVNGRVSAGQYSTVWEPSGLANGVYLSRLTAGGITTVKKIVLIK